MANLLERCASLGANVPGEIHPFEDPEHLLGESLAHIGEEDRLLGIIVSWLKRYGHLLLTKKIRCASEREKRLLSALIRVSETRRVKLVSLVGRPSSARQTNAEFLYSDLPGVLKEASRRDADPIFLKYGFYVKRFSLIREQIILPPQTVYQRSEILRHRALYGPSLRSDVIAILPQTAPISLRQLAHSLHVRPQTLYPIIQDYLQSGLVEWERRGRFSRLRWRGSQAAAPA